MFFGSLFACYIKRWDIKTFLKRITENLKAKNVVFYPIYNNIIRAVYPNTMNI